MRTSNIKIKDQSKNNLLWTIIVIAIFVFLILNIVLGIRVAELKEKFYNLEIKEAKSIDSDFTKKIELQGKCPDSVGGNNKSYLKIKYFYSQYCPWCKKEEPILQKLVKNQGDIFHIEWYNINYCPVETNKYRVSGVPSFVFSTADENKEYSHYGFIYEKDLNKLICDVTGGC